MLDEKRLLTLLDLSKVLESDDYLQISQVQKDVKNIMERKMDKTRSVKTNTNENKEAEVNKNNNGEQ